MKGFVMPAIPFLGWIIALLLGSGAVWTGANILKLVQLTLMQLAFFAAGIYVLVAHAVPSLVEDRRYSNPIIALVITGLAVLFILLGIPGLLLKSVGATYSVVMLP